eukprot:g14965.t1
MEKFQQPLLKAVIPGRAGRIPTRRMLHLAKKKVLTPLVPCPDCHRSFKAESLEKHKKICKKVFQQKRKQFNSAANRLGEFDNAQELIANAVKSEKREKENHAENICKDKSVPKWKAQSLAFRQAILSAKGASGDSEAAKKAAEIQKELNAANLASGGNVMESDMVKCPHCGRTFNEEDICQTDLTENRPRLLTIDVRAVNIPLFDNESRAVVGTDFKRKGRYEAIRKGLQLAGPNFEHGAKHGSRLLVYCWRGGMRSGSMAWLFSLSGYEVQTLQGGYRSYRRWCKKMVGPDAIPPAPVMVLGGCTGVGKTAILHELRARGKQILDLEEGNVSPSACRSKAPAKYDLQ